MELVTARFSPDTINVSVIGEVETAPNQPSQHQIQPTHQVRLTAGGFKESRVYLIRPNIDGKAKQAVAINLVQGVSEKSNPILPENDIIVVSRSGTTLTVDRLSL